MSESGIVRVNTPLRYIYVLSLALAFPLFDMLAAWLLGSGFSQASMLRGLRDASVVAIAGLCLVTVRLPQRLSQPVYLYFVFVAIYTVVGLGKGVVMAVALPSAGTLILPVLLFLVGYYCLRSGRELQTVLVVWIGLGVVSTLFGMWDIDHTEFWIDTVHLPDYMVNVKRVELGLEPETQLPWNFFASVEMERRAAGLLAAPLAQGAFLATTAVMSLALFARRWRAVALLLAGLMTVGIWQSGTRGALVVEGIGIFGVIVASGGLFRARPCVRRGVAVLVGGVALSMLYWTIKTSLIQMDGSTVGHWEALLTNLRDFPQVLAFGEGVGRQGAIAAQSKAAVIGGGEGAFFSLAFQLGLPGAVAFLWFYVNCIRLLMTGVGNDRELAWGVAALMAGFATTLVTSEHILTFSGMAAPWLMAGGAIRVAQRCLPWRSAQMAKKSSGTNGGLVCQASPATVYGRSREEERR